MPSRDLVFRFLGVDGGAGREFDRMAGKSASLEKAIGTLGVAVTGMGIALGVESVRAAAKFQTAMELIHTQAGAAQAEVNRMSKSVLALAGPTATAPEELAKGLYHLESAGFRGQKALLALKTAAEGAKIGGANLEDVTNALNATLVSGIKGSTDMSKAMGALNATVGAGDMRMQDLAEALGTGVLASVKGFGLSLNDVGAALATFGDNNIRGADAATQLRMAVLFMAKPAASAKATLKELGLTSHSLANDMGKGGLGLALTDLHDHLIKAGDTGAKTGQVLLDLFGHRAGTGISILEQQFARFQQKQEQVQTGSKNFASDWTGYTQTFGYSWDRAKSSFESMTIQIGTKLLPTATRAMNWIGTTGVGDLEKFSGWVSRNKTPIEDLAKVLAAIAAFRFASSKLNDISRLLGFGSKGLGGAGGGILGSAKPIPVYVTNMGGGGFGGVGGKGASGVERAGEGAAAEGVGARVAARVGLTGISRLAGPLYYTYLATQGGDQAPGQGKLFASGIGGSATSTSGRGSMAVAGILAQMLGGSAGKFMSDNGSFRTLNTTGAVADIMGRGDKSQVAQLKQLAQAFPAVAKAVRSYTADVGVLSHFLADNTGLTRANAAAQRQVAKDTISSLKAIPGAMKDLAAQAKAAGLTIGQALDDGITVGIRQGKNNIDFVSISVIDGVKHVMNNRAQIASPSKMTAYIGRMLAEGLGIGMQQGESLVAHAGKGLVSKVQSSLDALIGNRTGMREGISSNLIQGGSLSNLPLASLTTGFGTSYTAAPTIAGMQAFLGGYVGRERTFARNLALARKKGLSPMDAANIAQMGLDVGGPLIAALAGGTAAQNRGISAQTAQVTALANQIGTASAGANYDRQIAELQQVVAELQHLPQKIAKALTSPHATKALATSATRTRRAK